MYLHISHYYEWMLTFFNSLHFWCGWPVGIRTELRGEESSLNFFPCKKIISSASDYSLWNSLAPSN